MNWREFISDLRSMSWTGIAFIIFLVLSNAILLHESPLQIIPIAVEIILLVSLIYGLYKKR